MSSTQIAFTLDADYYTSQEIHKKELEAIFYRSWQYVCHKSQIKSSGDYFAHSVGNQGFFLVRGKDELVRGFYNVCPHRAHPIVNGCGNKQMLVCPYHSWTFFLNGQLRNTSKTHKLEEFDPTLFNLSEVRVEEFLGFYFINLDEKSPSLKSLSGHLESEILDCFPSIERLEHFQDASINVNANWKVLVDHNLDCRHAQTCDSITHGVYSSHGAMSWWLWPNLFITIMPNLRDVVIVNANPQNVTRSIEKMVVFTIERAAVHEEMPVKDMALCENVQQGLASRAYQRGPLIIDRDGEESSEHALAHFHILVQDALSRLKMSSKTLRTSLREPNVPV